MLLLDCAFLYLTGNGEIKLQFFAAKLGFLIGRHGSVQQMPNDARAAGTCAAVSNGGGYPIYVAIAPLVFVGRRKIQPDIQDFTNEKAKLSANGLAYSTKRIFRK
ncbi:MAG: hypothetical protein R3C56_09045 [Pirellulaceae bacterium]